MLNETYTNKPNKIIELIDNDILNIKTFINITSLFKYSYHGISNKILFKGKNFAKLILKYIMINVTKNLNYNIQDFVNKENFFDQI